MSVYFIYEYILFRILFVVCYYLFFYIYLDILVVDNIIFFINEVLNLFQRKKDDFYLSYF